MAVHHAYSAQKSYHIVKANKNVKVDLRLGHEARSGYLGSWRGREEALCLSISTSGC